MARKTARVMREVPGGIILGCLAPDVFIENLNISVVGDQVESHGGYPHSSPVVATGSPDVFSNNSPVARIGDSASCGHQIPSGPDRTFTN